MFAATSKNRASQWRANNRAVVTFPSGSEALIRALDFSVISKLGNVIDPITPYMQAVIKGNVDEEGNIIEPSSEHLNETVDAAKEFIRVAREIAMECFVDPRVYLTEDEADQNDGICVIDLSMEDLAFLVSLLGKPAKELQAFSVKQGPSLEPLDALEVDVSVAESSA